MFERELTTEEKLKLEIERLKEQNQRERSDISAILWVIFILGVGYGFYADNTLYRFTHNVGQFMAPLVGLAAVAFTAVSKGYSVAQGVIAGIVFDIAVFAVLNAIF